MNPPAKETTDHNKEEADANGSGRISPLKRETLDKFKDNKVHR